MLAKLGVERVGLGRAVATGGVAGALGWPVAERLHRPAMRQHLGEGQVAHLMAGPVFAPARVVVSAARQIVVVGFRVRDALLWVGWLVKPVSAHVFRVFTAGPLTWHLRRLSWEFHDGY